MSQHYLSVRQRTESLCAPLLTEDYIPQAADFVSPPKWHLAHSTWFFEELLLKVHLPDYKVFDKAFSFLFNSYYQSLGERASRGQRGLMTRPSVEQVYAYRNHVDEQMNNLLQQDMPKEVQDLVVLGLNHEQQHQELLLSDLKYTLSINPIHPVYKESADYTLAENKETGWHAVAEGNYPIGYEGSGFHFDNELGRHEVHLQAYEIAKGLVTNGAYLEFMEDEGYDTFSNWLDDGWTWVQENRIQAPLYWKKTESGWKHYTLAGLKDLPLDAPVCHISYYEANAYAAWKGLRLPTEFEWETAAEDLNWGQRWEWSDSPYSPYPHFKIAEGAVGEYNGKFMVNQMVLRGCSKITAEGHSRKTYRNFFHPPYRWQYTGIRLARS